MSKKTFPNTSSVPDGELRRLLATDHHDPFTILGAHSVKRKDEQGVAIRVLAPDASGIDVLADAKVAKMSAMVLAHPDGFFEAWFPNVKEVFAYRLRFTWKAGGQWETADPYSFLPILTDEDRYLFNAGDHHRIYEKLGAHPRNVNGVDGVSFAVWAPNARSVSVIGGFNTWDPRRHQMRVLGNSGIWELFIPGLGNGDLYKFQVRGNDKESLDKTDPYATEMEIRPKTASVVNSLDGYDWKDGSWIRERPQTQDARRPMSVYEVHLGSWMRNVYAENRWHTYRELAHLLVDHVKARGYTHIELMPVMEHPFDGSWGYQVTGYYAPTSRFGHPHDFMYFVDHCHQNGIGVILDWVPAHFPKDDHALSRFDGSALYEHEDPRKGEHQDWGTLIFNYGRSEVKNFLLSNALFWVEKYHIDGLRIDAVASMLYLDYSRKPGEWIPNQYGGRENIEAIAFVKALNGLIHHYYPGVLTVAEESTAWPQVTGDLSHGGLGFSMKWNMGWMHDTLEYFTKNPVHRSYHQGNLTFALLYAFSERFLLPLSHDEVVHGKGALLSKMPGDEWQQFANLRSLYGLMYAFPGKKLLFMGGEIGQRAEWDHDRQLDWFVLQYDLHRGVQRLTDDLNRCYRTLTPLHEVDFSYTGFEWVDFHDAHNSVIAFLRWNHDRSEHVLVVCNFTPVPRPRYRVGAPYNGRYAEVVNTDSTAYAGSNIGNGGEAWTEAVPFHGRPNSLVLTLPPLGVLYLRPSA
ncbi:MAG: 1,4-alpha-glucan branching protein GlgB [Bacteroidetes bacterium]|jgi:1,4-alpha-glucan branching enzyme|nr:1,4-alpha-glucan branching protein GlgB [Bacteroidota bacterium]